MKKQNVGYLLLLPRFKYEAPETVESACSMLSLYGDKGKVLAGGTDLVVSMKKRELTPDYVISIKNIKDLDYIILDVQGILKIGALATLASVAESSLVKEKAEVLATACKKVGTPQVRNMGTVVGNVCQAGPSQDTVPALLALDAKLKIVSGNKERVIPISEFFKGPFQSVMEHNELLTEIQLPSQPDGSAGSYKWITKATEIDETLAGAAVVLTCDSSGKICADSKIALTSVAPYPFRARRAEDMLRGQKISENIIKKAGQTASEETKPRSRSEYRKRMTSVLVRKAITEAWENLQ